MKNRLLALIIAISAGAALTASATISINWATGTGPILQQDGTTPIDNGSLVQLIWSPTAVIDPIDFLNPTVPQGDDILLSSSTAQFGGFIIDGPANYDGNSFGQGEDGLVSGYVYTRAFSSAAPGDLDWYNEGGLVGGPLNDQDPAGPPPNSSDASGLILSKQIIVPEPATFALMGLGGLALAIRRRRSA